MNSALVTPAALSVAHRTNSENPINSENPRNSPQRLSVPYGGETRMQLTLLSGVAEARVRIDPNATELVSLFAEGIETSLRVSPGEVRVSWPRKFGAWLRAALAGSYPDVEVVLHPDVEWSLSVRGGLSRFTGDLAAGKLSRIDISGGMSDAHFDLPAPTSPVSVRVAGGVSELILRRPAQTAVSLAISGGVSTLHLDEQQFGSIGGGSRLVSGAITQDTPCYAVEISGGASGVCVTRH